MRTDIIINSGPVPIIPSAPRVPSRGNQDRPPMFDLTMFHKPYEQDPGSTEVDLVGRIGEAKTPEKIAVLLGALKKLDPILAAKESEKYLNHDHRLVQISAAKNILAYKISDTEKEKDLLILQNRALGKLERISRRSSNDRALSRLALAIFDLYPLYKDSSRFGERFEKMKDLALGKLNETLKKPKITLGNKLRILKALMVPGIVTEAKARWEILTSFAQGLYELGNSDKALRKEVMSRIKIEGPLRDEFSEAYYSTFHHHRNIQ